MGRSSASCFKIITCGSDSADGDDLDVPESKGSSDKRGWSFRKRSARHRVLSNTAISEAPTSAKKEIPEPASLNIQPPDTSDVPEKISVIHCTDEKPQLSTSADLKACETIVVTKDEKEIGTDVEESVATIIQAAVRGCLAQRELLKLKNVIKLQAAVRGHLVRQHAVGTLRCVQAIVKMQALVRARQARRSQEASTVETKLDEKLDKKVSKTLELEKSVTKPTVTYTSIEKLLSNKFARQLTESTPKSKPIHIKCNPSKPNSVWDWLERWMFVSSAEPSPIQESTTEQMEREKNVNFTSAVEPVVPSEDSCESVESKSDCKKTVLATEIEEHTITCGTDSNKLEASYLTSSVGDDLNWPQLVEDTPISKQTSADLHSPSNDTVQSDWNTKVELHPLPDKPEIDGQQPEQPKRSMKRTASEELDTEGKKFVFGSRKPSNPAFVAAQSKFEELSSTVNLNKSFSSVHQDSEIDSPVDTVSSGIDSATRAREQTVAEHPDLHNLRAQFGGSECGTELSVTSTLDSPDVSEVGAVEYEREAKISEETSNADSVKQLDAATKDDSAEPVSTVSQTSTIEEPEKLDGFKGESVNLIVAPDSLKVDIEPDRSDVRREADNETGVPAYRSSPEASPRSHMTVPDSHGTPSSQVSVKAKKKKTDKSGSNQKHKSSADKRSPSNPNHDSGARSSMEHLPKDHKSGKRRNSLGSARPDQTDQEPRDSSSSPSLPHFMQATESARAKIQANNSPRSSPDIHDRDYLKKRHSLPGANGRQGSPRIQRLMSQPQQGSKANGNQVVHGIFLNFPVLSEKKWQR